MSKMETVKEKAPEIHERLKNIISKIANGLNTPWPFPNEESEHDELLIDSAVGAGAALQEIGNNILAADWSEWREIPRLVQNLLAEISALANTITLGREDFNTLRAENERLRVALQRIWEVANDQ